MLLFNGQYTVTLDASGRCKFPPRVLEDFASYKEDAVVIHCLPEGCLGIYPEENWQQIRSNERAQSVNLSSTSLVARRQMRRFGALSLGIVVSKQGRITIPPHFRKMCGLEESSMILVGAEVGMELWSVERWNRELETVMAHNLEKGRNEMSQDLLEQY